MDEFKEILDNLILFTARPSSVQRETLYAGQFANNRWNSIKFILTMPISGTDVEWYYDKESSDLFFENQAKEFLQPGFLNEYKKRDELYFESFIGICKKINQYFSDQEINKKQASDSVKEFYDYPYQDDSYFYFGMSIWSFEQKVLPVLEDKLKKYFGNKFDQNWLTIISPTELSFEQKFRIELADIKRKKENISENELIAIQERYRFLGVYTPEDYGFACDHILKVFYDMEVVEIDKMSKEIIENKEKLSTLLLTVNKKEISEAILLINYNINFRNLRSERLSLGFAMLTPFYDYLIKELDFTREQIGNLTKFEVNEFLEAGKIPPKRSVHPGMLYFGKQSRILNDEEKQMFVDVFRKQMKTKEFQGKIANRGIAKGRVRVILSVNDLADFQEDEILVSQFTRPEYMFAIKKCAAIITNDGGITSHAAIVSRELKKPCIIGTKIATKVLKDGDMVEVDANSGIVRIIKEK